jgi:hypothetical protein
LALYIVAVAIGALCASVVDVFLICLHGWRSCGRVKVPATTLREGLALVLSSCGDWDDSAGDSVGLLGLCAVCPESNNLFSVGALAKGAKGTGHVIGGLCGAD